MKTLGQIAYEAYCEHTGWKSMATKQKLPPWVEMKAEIKEAWEVAASAIQALCGADLRAAVEFKGPDLRDEFAKEACGALIVKWGLLDGEAIAETAYKLADQMVAQRDKK